jgi:hypothetical protein
MDMRGKKRNSKAAGVAGAIKASLAKIPGIVYAFLAGSANDLPDPGKEIQIIVVGGQDLEEMEEVISEVEKQRGRTIRISSFTVGEFRDRRRAKDGFVSSLIKKEKIMLIGSEDEMTSLYTVRA